MTAKITVVSNLFRRVADCVTRLLVKEVSPMAEIKENTGIIDTMCVGRGGIDAITPRKKKPVKNQIIGTRYFISLNRAKAMPTPRIKNNDEPGPSKPKKI